MLTLMNHMIHVNFVFQVMKFPWLNYISITEGGRFTLISDREQDNKFDKLLQCSSSIELGSFHAKVERCTWQAVKDMQHGAFTPK